MYLVAEQNYTFYEWTVQGFYIIDFFNMSRMRVSQVMFWKKEMCHLTKADISQLLQQGGCPPLKVLLGIIALKTFTVGTQPLFQWPALFHWRHFFLVEQRPMFWWLHRA